MNQKDKREFNTPILSQPSISQIQPAIDRFSSLFSALNASDVRQRVADVYAADAYFFDTLKELRGIEPIRDYLAESGAAVESCSVQVEDIAISGENVYVRWAMEIRFRKLRRGQLCRSLGISQLKFNNDLKILFHRDYWDSAGGLFEHIPLVGFAIRQIKSRL
jgi:ketosteroid isomerase-like protein